MSCAPFMIDLFLMDALLKALTPGTRLILVGDADQLPPVGAGNVLGDMIDSEYIASVKLHEIFRQAQESMDRISFIYCFLSRSIILYHLLYS